MSTWLLLHYKLPNKPSALRVYIWRKLKRLGALLLHDAVWVLPETARTTEQIQWLAAEIEERGGNAYYWSANAVLGEQEASMIEQFNHQVDAIYSDLLKKIRETNADLQAVAQQYQEAAAKDFFRSELGMLVREHLTSKQGKRT